MTMSALYSMCIEFDNDEVVLKLSFDDGENSYYFPCPRGRFLLDEMAMHCLSEWIDSRQELNDERPRKLKAA